MTTTEESYDSVLREEARETATISPARRRHRHADNTSDRNPVGNLGGATADTQALAKKRRKHGQCVTCGQKTHKVSMFSRQRTGLTISGKVIAGICLKCHPIEGYIQRPDRKEERAGPMAYQRQEERAVVPNVVNPRATRGTRPEDDHRTLISGLTPDPFFRNAYDNDESTRGASIARSAGGSPIAMPRRMGPDQQQLKLLHQKQTQQQQQLLQQRSASPYEAFRNQSGSAPNPRMPKRGILKGLSYVDEQQEIENTSHRSLADSVSAPSVNGGSGVDDIGDEDTERDSNGFSELDEETVETVSVANDPYSYKGGGVMLQYGDSPRNRRLMPMTENIHSAAESLLRIDAASNGVDDWRGEFHLHRRLETLSVTACDENNPYQRPSTPPLGSTSPNSIHRHSHSAHASPPSISSEVPTFRSRSRSGLSMTRHDPPIFSPDDPRPDGRFSADSDFNRLDARAQKWSNTERVRLEIHCGDDEGQNVNTVGPSTGSGSSTRNRGSGDDKDSDTDKDMTISLNLPHTEQRVRYGDDDYLIRTNDQPTTSSSIASVPSPPPFSRPEMVSNRYPSDELITCKQPPSIASASTECRIQSVETDRSREMRLERDNSFVVEQEGYYPPSVSSHQTPEGTSDEEKVEIDMDYVAKRLGHDNRQLPSTIGENNPGVPNRTSRVNMPPKERSDRDIDPSRIVAHNPTPSRNSENGSNSRSPEYCMYRYGSHSARGTGDAHFFLSSQSGSLGHCQSQSMNGFGNTSLLSNKKDDSSAENDVNTVNNYERKQRGESDCHEELLRDNESKSTSFTLKFNQDPPGQESQMPSTKSVSARNSPRLESLAPPLYPATMEYAQLETEEIMHESIDQNVYIDLSGGNDENENGSKRKRDVSPINTSGGSKDDDDTIVDDDATQIHQLLENYSRSSLCVPSCDTDPKSEPTQSREKITNETHEPNEPVETTSLVAKEERRRSRKPPKISDAPIIVKCLKLDCKFPSVNELSLEALFDLATQEPTEGKIAIIKCGGVPAIVRGMWTHMDVEKVQIAGLYALWALFAAETLECDPMVQADTRDITDVVLISMQSHLQCASVQEAGCGVLACLASASARGVRIDQVASAGGMLTAVSSMENHPQELCVQEWGLRALYCECMASEANKRSFAGNGTYGKRNIDIIHKSMRAFPDELRLQEWGCRLYHCLSGCEEIVNVLSVAVEPLEILICALNQFNQRSDSAILLASACGALSNFATLSEQNTTPILTEAGIPAVIGAMEALLQSEQVQIEGCAAIANIASLKQCRVQTVEKGGIGAIASAMKFFPYSEILQEEACRALRSICVKCEATKYAILSNAVISLIISASKSHLRSETLQEMACYALAALALDNEHRLSIIDAGGLSALLDAMAMHGRVRFLQEAACLALQNLTMCKDHFRELMSCVVARVIRAMAAHENSEDIQLCACHIFWNLSVASETKQLVNAGVVKYVIKAMQHHPEASLIQCVACGALWSLMIKSNDVKVAVVNEGGVDAMLCALVMYPFDAKVLENACGALSVLCVIRDNARCVASASGIGTVVECMQNNVSSAAVITHGSLFLRNVALVNSNYAEEASACASTVLRGMQEHLQNADLQVECLGALCALAAYSVTCRERFLYADGLDVIRKVMNAHNNVPEIESEGKSALSHLLPDR